MQKNKSRQVLGFALSYLAFFIMISFVVTCCTLIFLSGMKIDEEAIRDRAPKAFANIFILTMIFTVVFMGLRYLLFSRKADKIVDASEKIKAGDYSVRLFKETGISYPQNEMDLIYKAFNEMARELESTESLQTDFISNVSHEMKTPLAVIQNYCTLLEESNPDERTRLEYLGIIKENIHRVTELVTNILKLNKLENQKGTVEKKTFDLGESVASCLLGFEQIWEEKSINLDTDIEDEVYVESDRELLSLVWNNLLSNAFKFTPDGGTVRVTCRKIGRMVEVAVQDTGCGIKAENGSRIFEKFYQGDTSHKTQGNGLGLALVKKVVDLVGGEISVASEEGKGSTFTFSMEKKDE